MPNVIAEFRGTYSFLSNFYRAQVEYEGDLYPTVEHAYQAAKTLDRDRRVVIAHCGAAAVAKAHGRRVSLRPDWEAVKLDIMRTLLHAKFTLDTDLRRQLTATAPAQLVEGNWWGDTYWGVCRGVGENHLGRLLMEIRDDA